MNNSSRMMPRIGCGLTGVEITPLNKPLLIKAVLALLDSGEQHVVVGHNLHSTYLYHTDEQLRRLYDHASIVLADGKPIEIDARFSLRQSNRDLKCERLGTTDWLPELLPQIHDSRIAVVGGLPGPNQQFVGILDSSTTDSFVTGFPGDSWPEKIASTVESLINFDPDLVIVGLGMPLQEHFLADHWDDLPPAVYLLVGGAIDQMTGAQTLAPRWLGKIGLEWAWRLASQPRRLSDRYLVEPWRLFFLRVRHKFNPKLTSRSER